VITIFFILYISTIISSALGCDSSKLKVDLLVRADNLLSYSFNFFLLRFIRDRNVSFNITWILITAIKIDRFYIWIEFWVCWKLTDSQFWCTLLLRTWKEFWLGLLITSLGVLFIFCSYNLMLTFNFCCERHIFWLILSTIIQF